jgi:hypothetical protein
VPELPGKPEVTDVVTMPFHFQKRVSSSRDKRLSG